ncbi:MAG: transglycosylase SLT domain-containing protein [Wenzhouxiangellaceae bacterium]|nr:transglycosylase SLT domain-containing protein [Wenzhouxiangellaceae bacterium]
MATGLIKRMLKLLVLALAGLAPVAAQVLDEFSEPRARFIEGWQAAGRGQIERAQQALDELGDYPLAPYLAHELLRQRLDRTPPAEVAAFVERHEDWSFTPGLRQRWLESLARRGLDDELLAQARHAESSALVCRIERIRLARGRTDGLAARVRKLWLSPVSQPRECDPLFDWWRRPGNPSVDDGWERFGLAIEAGELGLARYLRRYLDPRDRPLAEAWLRLARRPADITRIAADWPDQERARRLAAWSLHRLATGDWQRADALAGRLTGRFRFQPEEINPALRRIALFRAVDLDAGALAAIDRLDSDLIDDQLLAWRTRVALAHQDWNEVLNGIYRMSADQQQEAKWRYWQARALTALDRPGADAIYANLAREATYHGFLAALRSDRPLTLCSRELRADGQIQLDLFRNPAFVRALELYRADMGWHAPWTWQRAIAGMSTEQQRQAALLAAAAGWHERAIATLAAAALDAYPWRFPLAWRENVQTAAEQHALEPALVFGLMRAESALNPQARSPANARGLLQLIPSTAQAVSRRHGLPYRGPGDLYRPALNIDLGTAHLGELEQRFDGDWTRVAAAYNAGIARAQRWHERQPDLPADIWIETLSFHETRDYIPRVLAFATIYEWQLQQPARVLAQHLLARGPATFDCPSG